MPYTYHTKFLIVFYSYKLMFQLHIRLQILSQIVSTDVEHFSPVLWISSRNNTIRDKSKIPGLSLYSS
jgi:hypothetical protein